jgi:hypothetical protein
MPCAAQCRMTTSMSACTGATSGGDPSDIPRLRYSTPDPRAANSRTHRRKCSARRAGRHGNDVRVPAPDRATLRAGRGRESSLTRLPPFWFQNRLIHVRQDLARPDIESVRITPRLLR